MSRWPSANRQHRARRSTSVLPRTTLSILAQDGLVCLGEAVGVGRRDLGRGRKGGVGGHGTVTHSFVLGMARGIPAGGFPLKAATAEKQCSPGGMPVT